MGLILQVLRKLWKPWNPCLDGAFVGNLALLIDWLLAGFLGRAWNWRKFHFPVPIFGDGASTPENESKFPSWNAWQNRRCKMKLFLFMFFPGVKEFLRRLLAQSVLWSCNLWFPAATETRWTLQSSPWLLMKPDKWLDNWLGFSSFGMELPVATADVDCRKEFSLASSSLPTSSAPTFSSFFHHAWSKEWRSHEWKTKSWKWSAKWPARNFKWRHRNTRKGSQLLKSLKFWQLALLKAARIFSRRFRKSDDLQR